LSYLGAEYSGNTNVDGCSLDYPPLSLLGTKNAGYQTKLCVAIPCGTFKQRI